jgi:UPF0755 protein
MNRFSATYFFRCALLLGLILALTGCRLGGRPALRAYLLTNESALTQPFSVDDRPVRFVVEPGTPARVIGQNLQAAGLIGDDLLFEAYVRVNELDLQMNAGTFILSPAMTPVEIVDLLLKAEAAAVTVTIPEGWRAEQIADYLTEAGIFAATPSAAEEYRRRLLTGDLTGLDPTQYPFLQERPAGTGLEGYLFPDTYEIPAEQPTATDVLERQLAVFALRVPPLYAAARAAGQTDLSLYEVLTIASIVEREAVVPAERPAIARVYLNRLGIGMKLEADPTVQYAMGYQPATRQWWKTPVTLDEYAGVDSPYNTYLYPGLPPGPISNPGLSSIQAVLQPAEHTFLYFVALPDGSGRHVFAETFEEHRANVQQYLSGGR